MTEPQEAKKSNPKLRLTNTFKDLSILVFAVIFVFIFSYFFNVFAFLVEIFQKYPKSIMWIDETITGLLTLSIGLAIFSWRRWRETQKEYSDKLESQEKLLNIAQTQAQIERIICNQLHCDIQEYRKILSRELQAREQLKQK